METWLALLILVLNLDNVPSNKLPLVTFKWSFVFGVVNVSLVTGGQGVIV